MANEKRKPQFIGGPLDGRLIEYVPPGKKEVWVTRKDILDDDGKERPFFYRQLEDGNFHFLSD